MNLSRPHTAISPSLDGEVLATLAGTTGALTGRTIARLVGSGSQTGINRALNRLVVHGIVQALPAGRAVLYSLNRDHVAAPGALALVGLRAELVRRVRRAIGKWRVRPVHASLFGSAARGDGDSESDIDLFIVRPRIGRTASGTWATQVSELADDVRRWTGNQLSVSEVSLSDVAALRRKQPRVVANLTDDAIGVAGLPAAVLLRPKR